MCKAGVLDGAYQIIKEMQRETETFREKRVGEREKERERTQSV